MLNYSEKDKPLHKNYYISYCKHIFLTISYMDDIHDFGTVKSVPRLSMCESMFLLSTRLHGIERDNFKFYRNQTTMPSVT